MPNANLLSLLLIHLLAEEKSETTYGAAKAKKSSATGEKSKLLGTELLLMLTANLEDWSKNYDQRAEQRQIQKRVNASVETLQIEGEAAAECNWTKQELSLLLVAGLGGLGGLFMGGLKRRKLKLLDAELPLLQVAGLKIDSKKKRTAVAYGCVAHLNLEAKKKIRPVTRLSCGELINCCRTAVVCCWRTDDCCYTHRIQDTHCWLPPRKGAGGDTREATELEGSCDRRGCERFGADKDT